LIGHDAAGQRLSSFAARHGPKIDKAAASQADHAFSHGIWGMFTLCGKRSYSSSERLNLRIFKVDDFNGLTLPIC
jgi:hypothetical protein